MQPLPRNPAISALLDAEREHQLWDRKVLGYPVWPLLRLHHYRTHLLKAEGAAPSLPPLRQRADPMSQRLTASLSGAVRGISAKLAERDIWVLSASTYRRRDAHGVFQCIFAEHLRQQLGPRLLFIEKNTALLADQRRDDLVFIDGLHWSILTASKLSSALLKARVTHEDRRAFDPTDARRLATLALFGQGLEHVYIALLRKYRPKALFVLNSYSEFIPAQRAARRLGIPLIELQHGVIHTSHPGYVLAEFPAAPHTPDHIVVFGQKFGRILEECGAYWQGRWSVGGHGWLQKQAGHASWQHPDALTTVVVFSQGDRDTQLRLREFVPQLRQKLPERFELVLKPHPRELDAPTFYASACVPGVRLADPKEDSYALLSQARLSVCVYSTVALEALAFPCQSAVLRSRHWSEEISELANQSILHAADSVDDVAALAMTPLRPTHSRQLADSLFGLDAAPIDFLQMIETVGSGSKR